MAHSINKTRIQTSLPKNILVTRKKRKIPVKASSSSKQRPAIIKIATLKKHQWSLDRSHSLGKSILVLTNANLIQTIIPKFSMWQKPAARKLFAAKSVLSNISIKPCYLIVK
jgi:hypothetical protein